MRPGDTTATVPEVSAYLRRESRHVAAFEQDEDARHRGGRVAHLGVWQAKDLLSARFAVGLSSRVDHGSVTGDSRTLRLLTLNALFKGDVRARLRALGVILERAEHDVVCLQEVMYRGHARLLGRLAPALRYRAHTGVAVLRGGLVILSRWPITRYRLVGYPPARPLRAELLMRKGAQLATIAAPGGELAVLNTHLSANRDDDWSAGNPYTRVQMGELSRPTARRPPSPRRPPSTTCWSGPRRAAHSPAGPGWCSRRQSPSRTAGQRTCPTTTASRQTWPWREIGSDRDPAVCRPGAFDNRPKPQVTPIPQG